MSDRQTAYIRGTAFWAKIVGDPVPNYSKDGYEWVMDVALDSAGVKEVKALGIGDKIKNKDDERGQFIQVKQRRERADGGENRAPKIVNAAGRDWNGEKIGNGSKVDVKLSVVDYGKGKKKGVYLQGVRVLDLVTYETQEFPSLTPDDEFFAKASTEAPTFGQDFLGQDPLDDDLDEVV